MMALFDRVLFIQDSDGDLVMTLRLGWWHAMQIRLIWWAVDRVQAWRGENGGAG